MNATAPRRLAAACGGLGLAWLLIAAALAVWDHQGRWQVPGRETRQIVKLWLWWAGGTLPALMLYAGVRTWLVPRGWRKLLGVVLTLGLFCAIWARLIEPELTRVRTHTEQGLPSGAQPLRIALVADVHWGLFLREARMQRLLDTIEALQPDAVFVAGDWSYEPPLDLRRGYAGWGRLSMPVFGVLGNHDEQAPGPALNAALRSALQGHGVTLLEGQRLNWRGWELVGLDDLWGGNPRAQIARLPQEGAERRIVLTHQPNTVALLPPGSAHLILAGHTHGGQVRLPWVTRRLLRYKSPHPWWDGRYDTPAGRLLVTPGVGMIGLPLRLAVPPTIDLIELRAN